MDTIPVHIQLATNPPVHQWVVKEAYVLASKVLSESTQKEFETYFSNIVDGSKHEDYQYLAGDIVLPFYGPMPFLSHYWNPDKPNHKFFYSNDTCIERMYKRLSMAIDAYDRDEMANAYDQLGHIAHLLSDMSVPAHVHWDLHARWDTYEMGYLTEFNHQVPNGYNYQQWTSQGLEIATSPQIEELFIDLAHIAQQFDSNDCAGKDPKHFLGHSRCREHQPLHNDLLVNYDVSYADAEVHAKVCMPAAFSHVAKLFKIWEEDVVNT